MSNVEEIRCRAAAGKNVRATPLAEAAGMSRAAFYAAIKRGDIEAVQVGRSLLVPGREALRLLGLQASSAEPIAA